MPPIHRLEKLRNLRDAQRLCVYVVACSATDKTLGGETHWEIRKSSQRCSASLTPGPGVNPETLKVLRCDSSTDPRQLLAAQAIQHALRAGDAAEGAGSGRCGTHRTYELQRAAGRRSFQDTESIRCLIGRQDADKPTFIRDVERLQAEDFAGAADKVGHRDDSFVDGDGEFRGLGNLDQRSREAAAGEVAEAVDLEARVEQRLHGAAPAQQGQAETCNNRVSARVAVRVACFGLTSSLIRLPQELPKIW